jgi:DNA modification methylase
MKETSAQMEKPSDHYSLLCGDAVEVLRALPEKYARCCVTSPPYWGLRNYNAEGQIGLEESPEEYVERLVSVFREVRRVLADDGTLWVNLGDTFAANRSYQVASTKGGAKHGEAQDRSGGMRVPRGMKAKDLIGIPWLVAFALRADGWYLRSEIVWDKPNAMPSSVTDRPTRSHEQIFLLTKSPRYYYDHEAVKEEAVCKHPSGNGFKRPQRVCVGGRGNEKQWEPTEKRNRRSVWSVNTKPYKEAHFAVFPPDLIEPCILAGSSEGDVVLDPFSGSGTTGEVALKHGRFYVGIDLNPDYNTLAEKRLRSAL